MSSPDPSLDLAEIVDLAQVVDLAQIVDLEKYPIDQPDSARYGEVIESARAGLRSVGCAVIKDLIRPDALRVLSTEIWDRKAATHFSEQTINPYFHTEFNSDYPEDHAVNTFIERSSGFIPGDSWQADCATDMLFRSPDLARFLATCLEIPELHCYADPLAGLTANILDPGQQFTWHFDTNEFAVTVLVDEADDGGLFEFVPNIRSGTEEGFDEIHAVLNGGRTEVVTLDLRPGDLQIFRGRYSLHRVTRVPEGSKPRHAAIFAYTEQAGVIGRLARTQQLFGRVLPEHEHAELERVRADALLD